MQTIFFNAMVLTTLLTLTSPALQAGAANKTTGKATIYSDSFNGKKTASGKTYKKNELTVASNKLPLGSKVLIRNKKNGKTVTAKVTDRMAKNASAAVDLSKGAASKLKVNGTGQVDAKVVAPK